MSSFLINLFSMLLFFLSGLMILLVLIQRGRGGGLAGAFGGQGGQSALGVRAGDVFTKITIVMAVCWVILCGGLGIAMRSDSKADLENTVLTLPSDDSADTEEADGDADDAPPVFGTDEPEAEAEAAKPNADGGEEEAGADVTAEDDKPEDADVSEDNSSDDADAAVEKEAAEEEPTEEADDK